MRALLRSTSAQPLTDARARISSERRLICFSVVVMPPPSMPPSSRGTHASRRPGRTGARGSTRRDQGRALVARGEVWWVEHPGAGRRPFLVLTRHAAIPVLNALLAVPATRTIREIPTEVVLDTDDGMPEACALSLDNLTSVPKQLFRVRITRLSVERMSDVCRALALASGCS
jgi:mRNA interferase MazF